MEEKKILSLDDRIQIEKYERVKELDVFNQASETILKQLLTSCVTNWCITGSPTQYKLRSMDMYFDNGPERQLRHLKRISPELQLKTFLNEQLTSEKYKHLGYPLVVSCAFTQYETEGDEPDLIVFFQTTSGNRLYNTTAAAAADRFSHHD